VWHSQSARWWGRAESGALGFPLGPLENGESWFKKVRLLSGIKLGRKQEINLSTIVVIIVVIVTITTTAVISIIWHIRV
jgi:hypothetical protein